MIPDDLALACVLLATRAGLAAQAVEKPMSTPCTITGVLRDPAGDPMPPDRFDYWTAYMARHYPPAIAEWFMLEGRFGEWQMTGAAAILAGAQPCEGDEQ